MRIRPFFSLGLCLSTSAVLGALYAQSYAQSAKKPVRKAPVAPLETDAGAVNVRGDRSFSDGNNETSKLMGNVTVTQTGEDFILYAQSLIYSKPQNRAVATEKLRVETTDSTIRGGRIDADFDSKVLTLTQNVTISTHAKGDGITGNRQKSDIRSQFASKASKLYCDRVDWDYETRQATLTGNIRMTQGKGSGTCQRIEFDEPQNVVRLMGKVRFRDEKGQVYSAPEVILYNNENRIETTGGPTTVKIFPNTSTKTAPRPPKAPVVPRKPPTITDEDLNIFKLKPSPIPALRPEPTPTPQPDPAPETPEEADPSPKATGE